MKEQTIGVLTPLLERKESSFLPPQKGMVYRSLRHPFFRPYVRLIILTLFINLGIFLYTPLLKSEIVLQITLLNFALGILIRQHEVINFLFKLATSAPLTWPLSIRWALAKVYHFGGIHIGAFLSGTLWFSYYLSMAPDQIKLLGFIHLAILVLIMVVSLPQIRMPNHNLFERVARFGSWISLLLFWVQGYLLNSIDFIGLGFITLCLIKPWLHLKKVSVEIVRPSPHVGVSKFNYGTTPFAGSSTELSINPLFEWHSFANIPSPHEPGFRLCISRAGDWTGDYIDNLPEKVWVRGIPTAGVGNIELLFKKVIWVATGSGIGPCLPHLLDRNVPSRLVWSTRTPRKTYGDDLVNEILDAQPDAIIWDTTSQGKPDLVKLAFEAYRDFEAEAVIVISNKKLTFHLNYQLESRGIPSFGAIWDS
ncbi:MAG: hypothetical protein HOE90_02940 [Bacteriovoracaceae bacterium]|jgi:hypothetical protein|nr:hypothetical protein [Bacteriovoracaceae bacterium]